MNKSNPPSDIPRPRKQDVLPEIARLLQEGQSLGQIAKQLGLTKSTVFRWSKGLPPEAVAPQPQIPAAQPQDPATAQPRDPAESIRQAIEMFTAMRQELFDEWRASKVAKQVRIEEESGPATDPAAKLKKSVRTETRTGNPTYFKTALEVQKQISALEERLAALQGLPAAPADRLASLTDDDLENLSVEDLDHFDDDELYAIEVRLRAKGERNGEKFERPLVTNEEFRNMTIEELKNFPHAAIAVVGAQPVAPEIRQPPLNEPQPPRGEAPPPEPSPEPVGVAAAIPAAADSAASAAPPNLTWDQQHAAALREEARKNEERKKWTDYRKLTYGWDGSRR